MSEKDGDIEDGEDGGDGERDAIKAGKADPVALLDANCMQHVLRFVGLARSVDLVDCLLGNKRATAGGPRTFLREKKSSCISAYVFFKLQFPLSRVSRVWKSFLGTLIQELAAARQVKVDFIRMSRTLTNLQQQRVASRYFIRWLCTNNLALTVSRVSSVQSKDQQGLVRSILEICNTTNVSEGDLRLYHPDESFDTYTPKQSIADALTSQEALQEEMAKECPNLRLLCLHLQLSNGPQIESITRRSLFTKRSITEMRVCLNLLEFVPTSLGSEFTIFTDLIENLPSLRVLELSSELQSCRCRAGSVFHVASTSLRILIVRHLFEKSVNLVNLALDCPKLRKFVCTGALISEKTIDANNDRDAQPNKTLYVSQRLDRAETVPSTCRCYITMMCRKKSWPDEKNLEEIPLKQLLDHDRLVLMPHQRIQRFVQQTVSQLRG